MHSGSPQTVGKLSIVGSVAVVGAGNTNWLDMTPVDVIMGACLLSEGKRG